MNVNSMSWVVVNNASPIMHNYAILFFVLLLSK